MQSKELYKEGEEKRAGERARGTSAVIALLYLTLAFKFGKPVIKVVLSRVLLFHWYLEGPRDLLHCVTEKSAWSKCRKLRSSVAQHHPLQSSVL